LIYVLALRLHIHIHHPFHGAPIDYAGLAAAAAASWIGVPGPGEPVLIAAGVFAAKHQLDLASVLFTAWVGATVGGIAGWLIGIKAGRAVVTAPGPLRSMRLGAVARGDELFKRYPVVSIILMPSWISGIHRVRSAVYLTTNALGAALWALGIGLGAYFIGPTVVDLVSDLGLVIGIAVVALILAGVLGELRRRRRRRQH
jgi:membrane protein DedA with SNARE-associated domain